MYLISKPTRREREERLTESVARSKEKGIRGVVRNTEEAYEVRRQHEREGEDFVLPYAISGFSSEAERAEGEVLQRAGIKPEHVEAYLSRQKRLRVPFDWEKQ